MIRGIRFASLLVATLCAGHAAASCDDDSCVRVGSYNIQLLGSGGPAKTPGQIDELARRIALTMDMDVFVLQEINIASAEWATLKGKLEDRGFAIAIEGAFGGDDPGRKQHVVIGYRSALVSMTKAEELAFPTTYDDGKGCRYDSVRPPVAAFLKASSFDFVVIGAHLKSMRPVDGDPSEERTCDDDIRLDQAEKIVAWAAEGVAGEKDLLVVGDVNSEFAESEFEPFRAAGFASAMTDLPAWSGQVSYLRGGGELIDHILFQPSVAEFVPRSGYVYKVRAKDEQYYLDYQSDHAPVSADFVTAADDD